MVSNPKKVNIFLLTLTHIYKILNVLPKAKFRLLATSFFPPTLFFLSALHLLLFLSKSWSSCLSFFSSTHSLPSKIGMWRKFMNCRPIQAWFLSFPFLCLPVPWKRGLRKFRGWKSHSRVGSYNKGQKEMEEIQRVP